MRWAVVCAPSRQRPTRGLLALLALVVVCIGTGCGGPEGQILERWTLHAGARSHPIDFPVHLTRELPNQIDHYRLSADVEVDGKLRGVDLDLVIPYLPTQVSLRIDGVLVPPSTRGSEER